MALQIELDYPIDGSTYREDAEMRARMFKRAPDPLLLKTRPRNTDYYYWLYQELQQSRIIVGSKPQRFQNAEIYAWCQLRGMKLSVHDITIINRIDASMLNKYAEMGQHAEKLSVSRAQERQMLEQGKGLKQEG